MCAAYWKQAFFFLALSHLFGNGHSLLVVMQPTMNSKVQQNVFVVLNLCVDWGVGFFVERWLCKWRMVEFFFFFFRWYRYQEPF